MAGIWDGNGFTAIGPAGQTSEATSLNETGQVVGYTLVQGVQKPWTWKRGQTLLELPGYGRPASINNKGQMVGGTTLWQNGRAIDLNAKIEASGYRITSVQKITNSGMILAKTPDNTNVVLVPAQFAARDGKINMGFDPRGRIPWASVVKGKTSDTVKLVLGDNPPPMTLVVVGDGADTSELEVNGPTGGLHGGDNDIKLTGIEGSDSITTVVVEVHMMDTQGVDTGQVVTSLNVMVLPQRTVSLGIYRVEDPGSPATRGVAGPSPEQIVGKMNEIYAQAGIVFQLDGQSSDPLNVTFDTQAAGLTVAGDGYVQEEEEEIIINKLAARPLNGKVRLYLLNKSGVQLAPPNVPEDQIPYNHRVWVRGDTPNVDPLKQSFIYVVTTNNDERVKLIAAHEAGHVLGLSKTNVDPRENHDLGPFPPPIDGDGGLMKRGSGTDQPGLWMAHQDWGVANTTAANRFTP